MNVDDAMSRDVRACRPGDAMDQAARVMWERDCGTVPVVDERGRVLGMITDRDLCMAVYTNGRPLQELPVRLAMSRGVATCRSDAPLVDALAEMARVQVRRMPVVDGDGRLVGILSLADAMRALETADSRSKKMLEAGVLAVMEGVTRPRSTEEAPSPAPAIDGAMHNAGSKVLDPQPPKAKVSNAPTPAKTPAKPPAQKTSAKRSSRRPKRSSG